MEQEFQSTPPVKAATSTLVCPMQKRTFQSTPPVKAATVLRLTRVAIVTFQSTPPVKAATCRLSISDYADTISIHAAREGGDDRRRVRRY